jgi:acetyltransferase-like isoleucine patch superfamily enzyme
MLFASGGSISVGQNSFIGEGTRIWSAAGVSIGNNVLISYNCNIIDTNSHELDHLERADGFRRLVSQGYPKDQGSVDNAQITIGDYAWISFNSTILKGVKIGEGAIVAAGSVVTKDVPPFTLVGGNPARVLRNLK